MAAGTIPLDPIQSDMLYDQPCHVLTGTSIWANPNVERRDGETYRNVSVVAYNPDVGQELLHIEMEPDRARRLVKALLRAADRAERCKPSQCAKHRALIACATAGRV